LVGQLLFINKELASIVAKKVGVDVVKLRQPNESIPADADPKTLQSKETEPSVPSSAALSMANTVKDTIESRIIGFIMENGVNGKEVNTLKSKLEKEGAVVQIISGSLASVKADNGTVFTPMHSLTSTASVCFDALYLCGGKESAKNLLNPENKADTLLFVNEAYKHCKAIYFGTDTDEIYIASNISLKQHEDSAIVHATEKNSDALFIKAVANHRVWEFEQQRNNPA